MKRVLRGQKAGKMSALAVYRGSGIGNISNKPWGTIAVVKLSKFVGDPSDNRLGRYAERLQ